MLSERDLGCAYSWCGFNDAACKKDSCCELPRPCPMPRPSHRDHVHSKAGHVRILGPFNAQICFSSLVPRGDLTELQGNASCFLQLKIVMANAALRTAPEQLVQGCHARSDRAVDRRAGMRLPWLKLSDHVVELKVTRRLRDARDSHTAILRLSANTVMSECILCALLEH